jgi:hypothetical protein
LFYLSNATIAKNYNLEKHHFVNERNGKEKGKNLKQEKEKRKRRKH